jgi:hypothetical protein
VVRKSLRVALPRLALSRAGAKTLSNQPFYPYPIRALIKRKGNKFIPEKGQDYFLEIRSVALLAGKNFLGFRRYSFSRIFLKP